LLVVERLLRSSITLIVDDTQLSFGDGDQ